MSRGEYDKIRYLISGRVPYVPFARAAVPSFFPPSSLDRAEDAARESRLPRCPTKRTISTKGRHRTRTRMLARTRAGTALMSRETCRLAGHRVTSASGRSPRRMWSRWARLGHTPSGRPIVLHAYTLCRTLQCTARRRAAVARSSAHPATRAHAQVKKLNLAVFPVR